MKLATKITLAVVFLVGYIFLVNLFAEVLTINDGEIPNNPIRTIVTSGTAVEIGFSDSVVVTLTRNRMYGKIIVEGEVEYLYLFNLIKLPKKVFAWNFYWFHILFLVFYILFLVFTGGNKSEKVEQPSNQNVYIDYESYY